MSRSTFYVRRNIVGNLASIVLDHFLVYMVSRVKRPGLSQHSHSHLPPSLTYLLPHSLHLRLVIPLQQSYAYAGEFTVFERMKRAIRENVIFYAIAGVISLVFVIWVAIANNLTGEKFGGFIIAASNAWALLVLITMLGYGLVEVPRKLWNLSNPLLMLRYYQFRTISANDRMDDTKVELYETLKEVQQFSDSIEYGDPLREFMDHIVDRCPNSFKEKPREPMKKLPSEDITEKALASLNRRLMIAVTNERAAQHMWEFILDHIWELEDELANVERTDHIYMRSWENNSSRINSVARRSKWYWRIWIKPKLFQMFCILFALMSVVCIWSECTMSVQEVDLSIWSQLLHVQGISGVGLQILVFFTLGYLALCCFYSLFKLRLFSYYQLLPKQQSDANSLLFSAAYLCRLTVTLAYNFLNMIHEAQPREHSMTFSKVMGTMNVIPFFGTEFNLYFPIFVALFCLATLFNVATKCAVALNINKFKFEEDYQHQDIERGKQLIERERERMHRRIEAAERSRQLGSSNGAINVYRDNPNESLDSPSSSTMRLNDMDGNPEDPFAANQRNHGGFPVRQNRDGSNSMFAFDGDEESGAGTGRKKKKSRNPFADPFGDKESLLR
eukprot:TRINITY_DN3922_c0_g1_i3.p1 TRINITY_DN3922_c0_g1~~TRINITY_DN3922_c0_g1_i3.p1  ORF type:complete len:616 (+),score=161.65 TRINITY_DN3922_c0_g1_i3:283-2130(+)